jgi:ribosomal protein S18 acetylase RimI-like enzyme
MTIFSDPRISLARESDVPRLTILINSAYRGDSSRAGWTTEADLIEGEVRTDETELRGVIATPGSVFLTFRQQEADIMGCVNLQEKNGRLYLGLFTVSPTLQGGGIGKLLMEAAEEYARHVNARSIYLTAISVRTELIAWYQRRGYVDTGERVPFPEDGRTGKHTRDLEFMVMEKMI